MNQSAGESLIQETILTCIGCPMGCLISVSLDQQQQLLITGEQCSRGKDYARTEIVRPTRTLTTLIAVPGCRTPLSVKTSQPVPREMINACLAAIHAIIVRLPVERGAVLIDNLLSTGSDVVATRTLKL
jgi:CxxC motif-containing protein